MTAPLFQNLVAAAVAVPVVATNGTVNNGTSSGELLQSGYNVLGILDPTTLDKIFNAVAEGNPVASGDHASVWLPSFNTAGFFGGASGTTVADSYWASVAPQVGGTATAVNSTGMVVLQLTPAASNTVEASSVMTFKVSPQAIVLLVPSTTAF